MENIKYILSLVITLSICIVIIRLCMEGANHLGNQIENQIGKFGEFIYKLIEKKKKK